MLRFGTSPTTRRPANTVPDDVIVVLGDAIVGIVASTLTARVHSLVSNQRLYY
jgi:hypothetical protein